MVVFSLFLSTFNSQLLTFDSRLRPLYFPPARAFLTRARFPHVALLHHRLTFPLVLSRKTHLQSSLLQIFSRLCSCSTRLCANPEAIFARTIGHPPCSRSCSHSQSQPILVLHKPYNRRYLKPLVQHFKMLHVHLTLRFGLVHHVANQFSKCFEFPAGKGSVGTRNFQNFMKPAIHAGSSSISLKLPKPSHSSLFTRSSQLAESPKPRVTKGLFVLSIGFAFSSVLLRAT